MTLWIDDGTDDGFLANCENCVFAVQDFPEGFLACGWDPPQLSLAAYQGMGEVVRVWAQPLVEPDMHCHHHPNVEQARDFGRGWQKGLRRPEDRPNLQSKEE